MERREVFENRNATSHGPCHTVRAARLDYVAALVVLEATRSTKHCSSVHSTVIALRGFVSSSNMAIGLSNARPRQRAILISAAVVAAVVLVGRSTEALCRLPGLSV